MPKQCKKCDTTEKVHTFRNSSFFSSILVILLPKCPFCIMAYSSAITVCGGQSIYMDANNWVSYIPLILSFAILCLILLNHRGKRTWLAASVATLSISSILLSHQLVIAPVFYDLGGAGLLIAIWMNGSLLHFSDFLSGKLLKLKNSFITPSKQRVNQ